MLSIAGLTADMNEWVEKVEIEVQELQQLHEKILKENGGVELMEDVKRNDQALSPV